MKIYFFQKTADNFIYKVKDDNLIKQLRHAEKKNSIILLFSRTLRVVKVLLVIVSAEPKL